MITFQDQANDIFDIPESNIVIHRQNKDLLKEQLVIGQRLKMIDRPFHLEVEIREIIGNLIQVIDKQGFNHLAECLGSDEEGEPILGVLTSCQHKLKLGYNPAIQAELSWN